MEPDTDPDDAGVGEKVSTAVHVGEGSEEGLGVVRAESEGGSLALDEAVVMPDSDAILEGESMVEPEGVGEMLVLVDCVDVCCSEPLPEPEPDREFDADAVGVTADDALRFNPDAVGMVETDTDEVSDVILERLPDALGQVETLSEFVSVERADGVTRGVVVSALEGDILTLSDADKEA